MSERTLRIGQICEKRGTQAMIAMTAATFPTAAGMMKFSRSILVIISMLSR